MNPEQALPALRYVMNTLAKPLSHEITEPVAQFCFWAIHDETLYARFLEELAIELDCSALDDAAYAKLPLGYGLLRFVFNFELACSFDGWLAFENMGKEVMPLVAEYYNRVGLVDEAAAILIAEQAWYTAQTKGLDPYQAAGQAYKRVENTWQDERVRRQHLLGLLRAPSYWRHS